MKGKQVLVTGATGFTGSVLTEKLCRLGAKVTAIHRRDNIPQNLRQFPIDWVKGDVYDPEVVKRGCEGAKIIFHVAAAYREAGIPDDIYWKVHVDSTKLLAKQALFQQGFQRFVHISTVGVHGHIKNIPADESSPFNPGDIYQTTKVEGEKWIRDFAKQNNLPLTVIRPAAIYGQKDRRLLKLFRMAKMPVVPIIGFSSGFYHLIHVDDLTECIIIAATHPKAIGEVFICGNESPIRIKEMIGIVAKEMGHRPKFIHLPAIPFFVLGWTCEILCKPFGKEPPIYRRRVAFFTKDRAFNTSKIRNVLGFTPRIDNNEGLKQTFNWYRQMGWL